MTIILIFYRDWWSRDVRASDNWVLARVTGHSGQMGDFSWTIIRTTLVQFLQFATCPRSLDLMQRNARTHNKPFNYYTYIILSSTTFMNTCILYPYSFHSQIRLNTKHLHNNCCSTHVITDYLKNLDKSGGQNIKQLSHSITNWVQTNRWSKHGQMNLWRDLCQLRKGFGRN